MRTIVRILRYLRPYWRRFAVSCIAMVAAGGLSLAFPYLAGRIVDAAVPGGSTAPVDLTALALVAILALQAACSFLQSYGFSVVGESALADLRRDSYRHLIRLPLTFHVRRQVGELASRLASDLTQIQEALVLIGPRVAQDVAILVGGVCMLALTSGRLTLVMLVSVPPVTIAALWFGRVIRRSARAAQDRLADSNVVIEETLHGIATVKAFTSERREEDRYRRSLQAYLVAVFRGARWQGVLMSFIAFALFAGILFVLWYGARLVQAEALSAGRLMAFLLYTVYVADAMRSVAELIALVQRVLGATQRVRELFAEPPEKVDPSAGESVVRPSERLRGQVAFEDVSFCYPSRPGTLVLHGVTLRAEPGQRIALVGPSGAGKSTLVSLLLGFYRPEAGRVLLDGRDVREFSLYELRRQVAVVPQDVLLFGGTIGENIAYGRPGAGEDEVVAAAERANAHGFIRSFAEGYQTPVGERGVQLSGGQRQRIAIARALLRNPAVLLLDEATSALDAESEELVLEALDALMEGRTSLVIAHRLSTVRRADCIYVLKDGRTIESGTHDALMGRPDGVYRALCELQITPG